MLHRQLRRLRHPASQRRMQRLHHKEEQFHAMRGISCAAWLSFTEGFSAQGQAVRCGGRASGEAGGRHHGMAWHGRHSIAHLLRSSAQRARCVRVCMHASVPGRPCAARCGHPAAACKHDVHERMNAIVDRFFAPSQKVLVKKRLASTGLCRELSMARMHVRPHPVLHLPWYSSSSVRGHASGNSLAQPHPRSYC